MPPPGVVALEDRPVRVRWRLRPRPSGDRRRDDPEERERKALSALRVGHGLGEALELTIDSGAIARIRINARSTDGERWLSRVLLPALDPAGWVREPVAEDVPRPPELVARRRAGWPTPLRSPSGPSSWVDAFAQSLMAHPAGARLRLVARPLPDPAARWWTPRPSVPTGPVSHRTTVGASRRSEPPGRDPLRDERPSGPPLFWQVRIAVEPDGGGLTGSQFRRLGEILGRATRIANGNGLDFRPSPRWVPGSVRSALLAHEEVVLLLPSIVCATAAAPLSAPLLPMGRTPGGTVVGPSLEAHQGRHLAVLGETGMGKSSHLVALARRVSTRYGLLFFDPIGDTIARLDRELPPPASARTLRVDPVTHALRLNALAGISSEGSDPLRAERRLNDLVHALRRVRAGRYADPFWGPRLDEMLTRALRSAAALKTGTITDAHTLLATGARAPRNVPSEALGEVRELSERLRERPDDGEGARRLLYEIVRSRVLERMLCARDPELDPSALVEPGRVVLVSGNAPRVGESTARYLLSVYLALVWSELLARPRRSKTFVVLDEAQWFSHESLAEMLRLGRRENVHVVLATQAIASLPGNVPEAVWTNVADVLAFRGSPEEARELAKVSSEISAERLLSLPRGHAIALVGKGERVEPLRTLWLPDGGSSTGAPTGGLEEDSGDLRPPRGLGTEPDGPPARPTVPRDVTAPGGSLGSEEPADRIERVLAALRAQASAAAGSELLRVSPRELRREYDPQGDAVRAVGALLGRNGILRAVERECGATVWALEVARLTLSREGSEADARAGDAEAGKVN